VPAALPGANETGCFWKGAADDEAPSGKRALARTLPPSRAVIATVRLNRALDQTVRVDRLVASARGDAAHTCSSLPLARIQEVP